MTFSGVDEWAVLAIYRYSDDLRLRNSVNCQGSCFSLFSLIAGNFNSPLEMGMAPGLNPFQECFVHAFMLRMFRIRHYRRWSRFREPVVEQHAFHLMQFPSRMKEIVFFTNSCLAV